MDLDDAAGEGLLALVRVARKWRPESGVPFRSYAAMRIEGAVIDAHRKNDPVGRHGRGLIKAAAAAGAEPRVDWRRINQDISALKDYEFKGHGRIVEPPQERIAFAGEVLALMSRIRPRIASMMERHFVHDEGLREIAKADGVSESRVCQLIKEGQKMLRELCGRPANEVDCEARVA